MKRILAGVAVVVIVIFALIGCGPSEKDFQASDPYGYRACEAFESAQGAGGSVYHDRIGRAASDATQASTPALREHLRPASEGAPVILDLSDFRSACKKAGYNFS
ncbi:hypothetical protein [Paeniglutamicibacter sp.]|uniref:hypothetical protein n=1 Tax=Paeniglutamicibacter sp. TaxID=1934391 RepID=UPI003989867B